MKISALPQKNKITYFEVQYFVNEGKQGKAKNVLVVTYSTERNLFRAKNDKSVQHREYFDLTCDREINRKTKKYYGPETSDEIKRSIKALKMDQGITTMFGIRQVRYKLPHRSVPGKWFHKRQLDVDNLVFVHIIDHTFTANFSWAGEEISVVVAPHRGTLSINQSVGVGYYTSASADAELEKRMREFKQAKEAESVANDIVAAPADTSATSDDEVIAYCETNTEAAASEIDVGCTARIDGTETASIPDNEKRTILPIKNFASYTQRKYVQATEFDVFQEMCKNSIYVDDDNRPVISLGLSFQLPCDDIIVNSFA